MAAPSPAALEKSAELGSLSSGDVQKLCESLSSWMQANIAGELKEVSCRTAGLIAAGFGGSSPALKQTACTAAYDDCMKKPAEPVGTESCEKPSSSCKATVGELEACINEMAPLMSQLVSAFPDCAQIAAGATATPPTNLQTPASCKTFQSKCEDIELPSVPGTRK